MIAVAAIATVGCVAACGIDCAAAEEDESVALGQFDARTGTIGFIGVGTYEVDGNASGHVEIYRAMDGRTATVMLVVGEIVDVVV